MGMVTGGISRVFENFVGEANASSEKLLVIPGRSGGIDVLTPLFGPLVNNWPNVRNGQEDFFG